MKKQIINRRFLLIAAIVGVIAVGFGLLMGQLGTIFQAIYSLSGALKGPVDGIFITGIFAPWTNLKVKKLITLFENFH